MRAPEGSAGTVKVLRRFGDGTYVLPPHTAEPERGEYQADLALGEGTKREAKALLVQLLNQRDTQPYRPVGVMA